MELIIAAAALCLLCQGCLGETSSASESRFSDLGASTTGSSLTATPHGRTLLFVDCTSLNAQSFASGMTCGTGEDPYCCSCATPGCGGTCTYCDYSQGCTTCPAARPKAACCINYSDDYGNDIANTPPPPPPIVASKKSTGLTCLYSLYGDSIACSSPALPSCCTSKDPQEAVCSTYLGTSSGFCPSTQPFEACCQSASQSPPSSPLRAASQSPPPPPLRAAIQNPPPPPSTTMPPSPPAVETQGFNNSSCVFGDALSCTLPAHPSCCTANTTSNKTYCSFYDGDSSGSCPITQQYPACCAPFRAPPPLVTSNAPFPRRALTPPSPIPSTAPEVALAYAPVPASKGAGVLSASVPSSVPEAAVAHAPVPVVEGLAQLTATAKSPANPSG